MENKKSVLTIKDLIKVKHLNIIAGNCYLNAPKFSEEDWLQMWEMHKKGTITEDYFNDLIKKIKFKDEHPLIRWNTRVGPFIDQNTLSGMFTTIFNEQRYRIQKIKNTKSIHEGVSVGVAILDNDIVFTYSLVNEELTITTFLGRISLNPGLTNFHSLMDYLQKSKDKLDLTISSEELAKQFLPIHPRMFIQFKGSTTEYILEEYGMEKLAPSYVLYSKKINTHDWTSISFLSKEVNKHKLPNAVLQMLYKLGHRRLILGYIKHFEKERWNDIKSKFSKQAIRKFVAEDKFSSQPAWKYEI